MKTILITNDDGIEAGGIVRLAEAAAEFGEVWVVAPARQMSAASHSITLHSPVDIYPHSFPVPGVRAFSCSGTPGDCVRVGSLSILPRRPDVVLSGINYGYNVAKRSGGPSRGMIFRDHYRELEKLPGGGIRLMVEGVRDEAAEDGTDLRAVTGGYVSVGIVKNIGY